MARSREEGMEKRILETAITVFGDKGFQATTLKDIAAGAGISTGSVYTYFADKDDLFRAAVEHGWDRFIVELEGLTQAGMNRRQRTAALLDNGFQTLELALPLLRGMLFDSSRQSLLEPSIERVISAIDTILLPDTVKGIREERKIANPADRHQIIRIMVNGILFTAAFSKTGTVSPPVSPGKESPDIRQIKESIAIFLGQYETGGPDA